MFNKDEMIKIFDELFIQSKKHYNDFNEADGKIGDGDLGITIQNGFQEIVNNKDNFTDDLGHNFMLCSQAFVKKSGSSFGTLVAFCLMNISKSVKGKKFLKHEDVIEIFEICCKTIKERGKTNLGDKTILDTLDLILNKIKETNDEIKYCEIFKTSTQEALENFKGKKILIGRARMFEDKTKDFDDPGMLALNKLAQAFD
jgi:dihydroxyacetone kinase-like protein